MKPANLLLVPLLACLLVAPHVSHAQSRELVTVLAFTDSDGDSDTAERLYNAVRTQIEFHRDYSLNDVPPQTLDDLLMAVGCASLDADCSELVGDIVQSGFLAWGEIVRNEAQVGVRMTLWNLRDAEEVRAVSHLIPTERSSMLTEFDSVVGRSLLYEEPEALTVEANAPGTTVFLDGVERGAAPTTIVVERLGFYEVEVVADGYRPFVSTAVVDLGGEVVVAELEVQEEPRRNNSGALGDAAPWIVVGAGVAVAATGAVFGIQANGTQNEFDDVVSERVLDRARAEDLQSQGENQAMLSNVFLGTGAALIVGGVIYKVIRGGGDDEDSEEPWARVGGFASADGGGVTLDFLR